MKKTFVTLLLLGLAVGGFAVDFSAGAGGSVGLPTFYPDFTGTIYGSSVEVKESVMPIDIKVFIDVTYMQVSVGYMFISGGSITSSVDGVEIMSADVKGSLSYATASAYLKYPFAIGSVKLFPLVGLQYRLNLTDKDANGNDVKGTLTSQERADLNELWIEAGGGMDVLLGRFFLRLNLLIGIKPLSDTDRNAIQTFHSFGYTDASLMYLTLDTSVLLGYRF